MPHYCMVTSTYMVRLLVHACPSIIRGAGLVALAHCVEHRGIVHMEKVPWRKLQGKLYHSSVNSCTNRSTSTCELTSAAIDLPSSCLRGGKGFPIRAPGLVALSHGVEHHVVVHMEEVREVAFVPYFACQRERESCLLTSNWSEST